MFFLSCSTCTTIATTRRYVTYTCTCVTVLSNSTIGTRTYVQYLHSYITCSTECTVPHYPLLSARVQICVTEIKKMSRFLFVFFTEMRTAHASVIIFQLKKCFGIDLDERVRMICVAECLARIFFVFTCLLD